MKIYVNQNPEPPVKHPLKLGGKTVESKPREEMLSRAKGFTNRFTKKNSEDKVVTRNLIKEETTADVNILDDSGGNKSVVLSEKDKNSELKAVTTESSEAEAASVEEESAIIEKMSNVCEKRGLNLAKKGKTDAASVVMDTTESVVYPSSSVSLVAIAILILCFALSLALGFFSGETIFKFVIDRGLFR